MEHESDLVRRLDDLERKYDAQLRSVFDAIRALISDEIEPRKRIGFRPVTRDATTAAPSGIVGSTFLAPKATARCPTNICYCGPVLVRKADHHTLARLPGGACGGNSSSCVSMSTSSHSTCSHLPLPQRGSVIAGLRSKNPAGLMSKPCSSSGRIGQSSGRATWWNPIVYQRTMSVSAIDRFWRVQRGRPAAMESVSPACRGGLRRAPFGFPTRRFPKQQGRSDEQRGEEPSHLQDLGHGAAILVHPGGQRDHGDRHLSERRRE